MVNPLRRRFVICFFDVWRRARVAFFFSVPAVVPVQMNAGSLPNRFFSALL